MTVSKKQRSPSPALDCSQTDFCRTEASCLKKFAPNHQTSCATNALSAAESRQVHRRDKYPESWMICSSDLGNACEDFALMLFYRINMVARKGRIGFSPTPMIIGDVAKRALRFR
jgi:hypothetical protein